ncbi:type II secretion system protein GspH [bacterium]|nr:type II secretion system protein GspH [bacterium]
MLTSVTGTKPATRKDRGFTLIEVMTALMVVALAASLAVLAAPGPDRTLRDAARGMGARILQAGDEAIIRNRSIALVASAEGYGFEQLSDGRWAPLVGSTPLSFVAWPEQVSARLEGDLETGTDRRVLSVFDPIGGMSPMRVELTRDRSRWEVRVDASGAVHVQPVH